MSGDNHSAPGFVIYFNSSKIPPERAAEVKKIIIIDKLNAPSTFLIKAADMENEWLENDDYFVGSEVKILIGYKDSLESIMVGEITGLNCHMKQNQAKEVTIIGNNHMHRLKRGITNKAFYDMTVKDIIADITDRAGMKSEIDELAYNHVFTLQNTKTDFEYLFQLADYYDCHFWVDNKTLYFKRLKQNIAEDVILEYGKTLLEFFPESDTTRIVSEVEVKAWNPAKHEAISATATFSDIDSKGGSVIDEVFGGADELCLDPQVLDQKTADQRAIDILELNNRNYVTGNGATYGNPEIRAGKIIKAEGLGEKFSGKYFVISAKHVLVPLRGYKTSFTFISSLGSPVQAGAGEEAAPKVGVTAVAKAGEEEQEDQEKNPQIMNLKWMKDGEEVTQAYVKDKVAITAETRDLDDGVRVKITIWEKDKAGSDDFIKNFTTYSKDGKIEKKWNVEYHGLIDDTESGQAQNEYKPPEYVFKMETTSSPEVESGMGPVLKVVDKIELSLVDSESYAAKKQKYIIITATGNRIEGETDKDGNIFEDEVEIGHYTLILKANDEEPETPEISNLRWMKDGEEVNKASIGDTVTLTADVKGYYDRRTVCIKIFKKDYAHENDFITIENAPVKNDKIELNWKVFQQEDKDDEKKEPEEEARGFSHLEYIFVIKDTGYEIKTGESPGLKVKGWIHTQLRGPDGEIHANINYILKLPDGTEEKGTTDNHGVIDRKDLGIGKYHIKIDAEEEKEAE